MAVEAARHLAANVTALRRVKRLTQRQLAELADIPRSTVTNIESGGGNPSLANLCRLSSALGVGVDELLSAPRTDCVLIPADKVPTRDRVGGRVRIHELLPEKVKGLIIERMELEPGGSMRGTPHVAGTKEYFHTVAGTVNVLVAGQMFAVEKGAVLAFPGDQPHSYVNRARAAATGFSVVAPAPVTDR